MSKIVLIKRGSKSDWISCQSITDNIQKAYELVCPANELSVCYLNNEDDQYDQWKLAGEVAAMSPESLIFIDHQPHPESFLLSLAKCTKTMPRLIFHVFGDFTLQTNSWINIAPILKEVPTKIIVASPKQKALLQNLTDGSEDLIEVSPFPIDTNFFSYEEVPRGKETTFLYTGRISTQKNILELITYFDQYNKNIAPDSKLLIAGPIDDLGIPFLGKNLLPGSYGSTIERKLAQIENENIVVLKNQNHEQLKELYKKADYYVSLSTHNDEDYGMSPAEALCCGLPCILSNWGGFSGFAVSEASKFIPVEEKNGRILAKGDRFIVELTDAQNSVLKAEDRKKLAYEAKSHFSIEAYSQKIKNLLAEEKKVRFNGFTPEMEMLASSHRINKNAPFLKGADGSYSDLYKKVYEPYFN